MNYSKTQFVGNTFWIVFRNIYSMLISVVVGALSARYLGPDNYGILNYGTSIIAFFITISALGFASTLVVEMVNNQQKIGEILGTALVLQIGVAIVSLAAILAVVTFLEPDNRMMHLVTMFQASVLIFNAYEVFLYWFQMKLEMRTVTIASIIALTVTAVWRIALLIHQVPVTLFALTNSITSLVTGACVVFFFFRAEHPHLHFRAETGRNLLSTSSHYIVSGLAVTLYTQVDRIMLGKMYSTEAVGYYSAALTISMLWEFVPQAIVNSARPILAELRKLDEQEYQNKYMALLLGISVLGIAVGITFSLFGKIAIRILYGEAYVSASPALAILTWSTSFAMICTARTIWLVSEGRNRYVKYFTFLGAGINMAMNVYFIPRWGITGASFATLITQVFVALIAPCLFRETRSFTTLYIRSLRCMPELLSMLKRMVKSIIVGDK